MQFAQRMLRFLKSPLFQIILYCMDQKKRWTRGLTWHWWSSKKNEFMSQDVLLMIIWEKTKTKLQTESSWNTQNNEYSRVRTSTIRVLSGFWRKVSHFFTDKNKNKNSRARFWSSDLWVMGPARFHCATLLRVSLRSFFAAPISKSSQMPVRAKRESWNDTNAGYV